MSAEGENTTNGTNSPPLFTVEVLFNFDPDRENSQEIPLRKGEIVTVYAAEDAWWEGQLGDGRYGLFPSNYVRKIEGEGQVEGGEVSADAVQVQVTDSKAAPEPEPAATPAATPAAPAVVTPPPKPVAVPVAAVAAASESKVRAVPVETKAKPVSVANATVASPASSLANLKTRYGMWASNMSEIAGWTHILMGICGLAWAIGDIDMESQYPAKGVLTPIVAIYSLLLGILMLLYEYYLGGQRAGSTFPTRSLVCLLLSGFFFLSQVGIISGIFMVTIAIVHFFAAYEGEEYNVKQSEDKKNSNAADKDMGVCERIQAYFVMKKEQNKIGVLLFVSLYFIANIVIFAVVTDDWVKKNRLLAPAGLSGFGPLAKGFGNMLDFNCSLVLVPVLRTILRWLYTTSTKSEECFPRFLRAILTFIPLDKNIAFHKLVAKMIVFSVVGHVFFHFVNYIKAPTNTIATFGLWPWISGGLIMWFMLLLYSAVPDNTKRGQYEIFWYSHHCFFFFFLFLLTHGKGGWGGNFWKWFVGPGALYVIERILRVYRSQQPVVVLSATWMPPDVFSLEFEKGDLAGYKEGMYLFLNCPSVSAIQWHAFTISSAPHEDNVTVHIRTCGPGSWTEQVKEYVTSMGPKNSHYVPLSRQGPSGLLKGKILGPDGTPMFQIDGPHSAPTQHLPEYRTAMVIGAGIGVTPVSSSVKEIVYKRWKYSLGEVNPSNVYFYWVCSYKDVDAFRWLIRIIKDVQDEVIHLRHTQANNMATKTFEFHIFVTSAPKDPKLPAGLDNKNNDVGFWGVPYSDDKKSIEKFRADFDVLDLYKAMMLPTQPHQQLGDIHIWNGRPNWDARFKDVAERHKGEVGVAFCGNPMIGADLATMCHKYSRGRDGIFKLHKENF